MGESNHDVPILGSGTSSLASSADDKIQGFTRLLGMFVVPALVIGFAITFLAPERTGDLFAWPIKPPITSLVLGATYFGGIYYFIRLVAGARWHEIALGLLPISGFAAVMGVSTILHWDRFTTGHPAFLAWAVIYFLVPILLPIAWLRNRTADPGPAPDELMLTPRMRAAFTAFGILLLAAGIGMFLAPAIAAGVWPWTLTPLTSRVLSAIYVLPGLVGLMIAMDGRWSAVRVILTAQALSIVVLLAASILAWDEINWRNPWSWLFVGGLVIGLLLVGWIATARATHRLLAGVRSD